MAVFPFADWLPDQDFRIVGSDETEAALLFITGNNRLLWISHEAGQRMGKGLCSLTAEERAEWTRLATIGLISDVNRVRAASAGFAEGAPIAINVNLTSSCNLECTYCFAEGGDYGRLVGGLDDVTEDGIFRFIESQPLSIGDTVRFEYFGGEPLLNFRRIQAICKRAEALERGRGARVAYRISTNLTLLPAGAAELFARNRFTVSVSIDGTPETQNRNRPKLGGGCSYEEVIENCRRLRRIGGDLTLIARMTVVGGVPSLLDNVRHLWALNLFDYFQIYPSAASVVSLQAANDAGACASTDACLFPVDYREQARELMAAYPRLFDPENRFKGILEVERIAEMTLMGKLALSFCSGGRRYFTFSPDDSIVPCHRLVGRKDLQVGSGRTGLGVVADERLAIWRQPADDHAACSNCWARYLCAGGCKQENLVVTGSLTVPSRSQCDHQAQLIESTLRLVAASGAPYRALDRKPLASLFVSCGRPVIPNNRIELAAEELAAFRHLRPVQ